MPESFSGGGVECEQIVGRVGGEEKMAGGGEYTGDAFAFADIVIPDYFSGFVIERADGGVRPENAIAAAAAFGLGFVHGVVVDAEDAAGGDAEKKWLWSDAGRQPVG